MMLADTMHPYPLFVVLSKCTSKATFIQRDCCHVGLLLWRSLTLFLRQTDVASPQGGALSLSLPPTGARQRGSCLPITKIKKWLHHLGRGGIKPTVTIAHLDMGSSDCICLPNSLPKVYSHQPVSLSLRNWIQNTCHYLSHSSEAGKNPMTKDFGA